MSEREVATLMKRSRTAIHNVIIKEISKRNKTIWKEEEVHTKCETMVVSDNYERWSRKFLNFF